MLSEDDDDLLDNHDNFNQTKQTSTTLTQNGALFSQKASTSQSNDQQNGNSKLNRVQNQINDVMDGMKTNIGKILERGQTLDNLNERSDELSASANLFHTRAKSTRKAMWLRTCRVSNSDSFFFSFFSYQFNFFNSTRLVCISVVL